MTNNKTQHKPENVKPSRLDTSALPLVSIIRYFDDYADRSRVIRVDEGNWSVICDGATTYINWSNYSTFEALFLKKFMTWVFAKLDATSACSYLGALNRDAKVISNWLECFTYPNTAKSNWELNGFNMVKEKSVMVLRSISKFLCEMSLCGWRIEDLEYVRGWKWFSPRNVSKVEHGVSYYLSPNEEISIVSHFDKLALRANVSSYETLRSTIVLYFVYQFGMRPIQIGSITGEDISSIQHGNQSIVHATFYKAKQKRSKLREPLLRKVKREWAPIISAFMELRKSTNEVQSELVRNDSLLNLTPAQISDRVNKLSSKLIQRRISPTLFRHIAAQRMADLGMSQLELAEFMGHTDIDSCLIYFENSATQANIINRALGLSDIYQKVKEISEKGLIESGELLNLKEDQQIGGAAHGIPLAGIGGCAIGQSMCELSPAVSCYTCPKFMPLNDINMHKNVAGELREVISNFVISGRNDASNPAFTQLTRTMEKLTVIIKFIESENE